MRSRMLERQHFVYQNQQISSALDISRHVALVLACVMHSTCAFPRCRLFENLRMLPHAPGVQMANIPEDSLNTDDKAEADKENPDERMSSRL